MFWLFRNTENFITQTSAIYHPAFCRISYHKFQGQSNQNFYPLFLDIPLLTSYQWRKIALSHWYLLIFWNNYFFFHKISYYLPKWDKSHALAKKVKKQKFRVEKTVITLTATSICCLLQALMLFISCVARC